MVFSWQMAEELAVAHMRSIGFPAAAIVDAAHLPGDNLTIILGDARLTLTNAQARDLGAAIAATADQLLEEADFQF